ncbi:hypothetical protein CerSpe_098810 [Prunus speciosa]
MLPVPVFVVSHNIHSYLMGEEDQARNNNLIKMLLSLLNLFGIKLHYSSKRGQYQKDNYILDPQPEINPSTWWLVPLPVHCIAESVKNQLPVVQYRDFLKIKTGQPAEAEDDSNNNDHMCIVCMNSMEGSQGIRKLCNCSHAFHKECLDVWIDEGQLTCPLCRSNLLPNSTLKSNHHHHHKEMGEFGEDPWRAERMIYLFGEDERA